MGEARKGVTTHYNPNPGSDLRLTVPYRPLHDAKVYPYRGMTRLPNDLRRPSNILIHPSFDSLAGHILPYRIFTVKNAPQTPNCSLHHN